ncbi:MAG: YdeI/OmpD-associated family protein, partial [Actinomycetota bacterium]
FQTTILRAGKTATGIQVPPEIVEALGSGKKPPVRVTVNGHTYRSTVAVMGGVFMIGVSAQNRTAAGVAGGDEVEVDVELDTEPRVVTVPPDLAEALDAAPAARRKFDSLSYSHQLQHVLAIEGAKAAETRQRRVSKAITMLSGDEA